MTLRGTVGAMQLAYLENWVMKIATTLNLQGVSLTVDNGCVVQIQSLYDPECPVPTEKDSPTVSGQQAAQTVDVQKVATANPVGLSVGLAVGCVAAVVVIIVGIIVATILLIKAKRSKDSRTM